MANGGGSSVRSLADDIKALGLDRYLLDTAVIDRAAADLTTWLRQETGVPVPGAVVRLGCRVVSAALFDRLKLGADRAFTGGLAVAVDVFERLPGADRFCAALRDWATTKKDDAEAMAQLEALAAGERRAIDPELLQTLSTDLRFQLQQVSKLDGVRDQLTVGFAEVLERLNPQPQLDPKLTELTETSRLYFGARKVPFVGREAELARLHDFTFANGDLSWWLVTGPGGMGKSRLALELCHWAGACWRTGFLPQAEIERFSWATWQPELPHLLVIDYAAALPEQIGKMIEALRLRQHNSQLEMPVRLLLLERRKEDRWWDKLLNQGNQYELNEVLANDFPLELEPLGADGIWSIVAAVGGESAAKLGRDSALERMTLIDPEMRPLFAALAGEALAAGHDLQQWSRSDLLHDWLKRERLKHWLPSGVDEPHVNLAALATMVGGIAEGVFAPPPDGITLPPADRVSVEAYAAITGREPTPDDKGVTWFPALEPDLLGAFFVLEHLRAPMGELIALPSAMRTRTEAFRRAAWSRDGRNAVDAAFFLVRAAQDFVHDPTFFGLFFESDERQWHSLLVATLVVGLTGSHVLAGELDQAEALLLDELQILGSDHPKDPELRLGLAEAVSHLIKGWGKVGRTDKAQTLLGQLHTLAADYSEEHELRLKFATASVDLIDHLHSSGLFDEAMSKRDQIFVFTREYPEDTDLCRLIARHSLPQTCKLLEVGRVDEAKTLAIRLEDFASAHSEESELWFLVSHCSVNLIMGLAKKGRYGEAETVLLRLQTLAGDYPKKLQFRLDVAAAGFGLVDDLAIAGQIDKAKLLLKEVQAFASGIPDDPDFQTELAWSRANLISSFSTAGRIDDARTLLDELQALACRYPEESEVWFQVGRGSSDLLTGLLRAGRIDEAEALLQELKKLEDEHPQEAKLQLTLARGSVTLISGLLMTRQVDEAMAFLAQLQILADNHPGDLQLVAAAGLAAVSALETQPRREDADGAMETAKCAEGFLRHPAVIADLRQRFGQDRAGQFQSLLKDLLNDV